MKKLLLSIGLCLITLPLFAQVDYATQIKPIFDQRCASCHTGSRGVDMRTYEAVMSSVPVSYGINLVISDSAEQSPLYDKVRLDKAPEHGSRMPQGGALSQTQVNLIRDWINEGALQELSTSNEFTELPWAFEVYGNYPNPFNPSTVISFSLPEAAQLELKVFNLLGNVVQESQGSFSAGMQNLSISLADQPSGVYMYRIFIRTATGSQISDLKKMTLIK